MSIEELYSIFSEHAAQINPFGATIQCIHESESPSTPRPFDSSLSLEGNNLTGIKASKSWTGKTLSKKTWEQKPDGTKFETVAVFRAWDIVEDFVEYHVGVINRLYPHCAKDNFLGYFSGLEKNIYHTPESPSKWGTDLKYFDKMLAMAWKYSPLFFKSPAEKWRAVLINAVDRGLFVFPEHIKIVVKFGQGKF